MAAARPDVVLDAHAPESPGQTEALRLLLVEYVDPQSGWGWHGGAWSVVFPPDVVLDGTPSNGWFLVRGQRRGARFVVGEVLRRSPIVAPDGAVLESSWPAGAQTFVRRWVRREQP